MHDSDNLQIDETAQTQEQVKPFATSPTKTGAKIIRDTIFNVTYLADMLELTDPRGNPTGGFFNREEAEKKAYEARKQEQKEEEAEEERKRLEHARQTARDRLTVVHDEEPKPEKEPDISLKMSEDSGFHVTELRINGKVPEVNQFCMSIPEIDFWGTSVPASIKSKDPFWKSKDVQKDIQYYIKQICNSSQKQAVEKLGMLVKLNQHIVLIEKPVIKQVDHEVKFETWLNNVGMWVTSLTIDEQKFPLVEHRNSLHEIDETRNKQYFYDNLNSALDIETKKSRKILLDINRQAEKIKLLTR
jgi:hypothetical protein